jgi:cytoskeleton protein RodZ
LTKILERFILDVGMMKMKSFGTYLKCAREERKISLAEISRATRIRRTILEAIEKDRREFSLPEVVVKGFIEAYARYIGLDPEGVLSKYAQWQAENEAASKKASLPAEKQKIPLKYIVTGGAGLILLIILSLLIFTGHAPQEAASLQVQQGQGKVVPPVAPRSPAAAPTVTEREPRSSPSSNVQAKVVPPVAPRSPAAAPMVTERAPRSSPPSDVQAEEEETSPPPDEHTLVIKASERTWIQIQEGSSPPSEVILDSGESYTRKSPHQLSIVIGNAGGVQVTFDGKVLGVLGEDGEVIKLKLPSSEEG